MSFFDIEKQIGSPMQIPIDLNSGNEYYFSPKHYDYADDQMSDIEIDNDYDNDKMSDNSMDYCEPDNDDEQQYKQQQYKQQQIEEQYKQKQIEIQQQQEEQYKKFIESLQFMSLNEQQIMLYQVQPNHCIIQMES